MELLLYIDGKALGYRVLPTCEIPEGVLGGYGKVAFVLTSPESEHLAQYCLLVGGINLGTGRILSTKVSQSPVTGLSWEWDTGEYVGRLAVSLEFDGEPVWDAKDVTVAPHLERITQLAFERMLVDIQETAYQVSPAYQTRRLGADRSALGLARLEYLRAYITPLERAVEAIARRPRRCIVDRDELVDLALSDRCDDRTAVRLLSDPGTRFTKGTAGLTPRVRGLYQKLGGLPERVHVSHPEETFNLFENQLVKSFLERLARVCSATDAGLQRLSDGPNRARVPLEIVRRRQEELQRIKSALTRLLGLDFLRETGPLRRPPRASQAFLRDPAYSSFYAIYKRFDRAIDPIDGEPFQLPLEKAWQLYEYWCFFRVVRILRDLWPQASIEQNQWITEDENGLTLDVRRAPLVVGRFRICFQESYEYYRWEPNAAPRGFGSYSHGFRPDIAIEVLDESGRDVRQIVLLDPKYRRGSGGLTEGIDALHRYKDAIVAPDMRRLVTHAVILCPVKVEDIARYYGREYIHAHGLGAIRVSPVEDDPEADLRDFLFRVVGSESATHTQVHPPSLTA